MLDMEGYADDEGRVFEYETLESVGVAVDEGV